MNKTGPTLWSQEEGNMEQSWLVTAQARAPSGMTAQVGDDPGEIGRASESSLQHYQSSHKSVRIENCRFKPLYLEELCSTAHPFF